MPDKGELVNLLRRILDHRGGRQERIRQYQAKVNKALEEVENSGDWEVLGDLAYDLDFFEPKASWRAEDPSFFGHDVLEYMIATALAKLDREHRG